MTRRRVGMGWKAWTGGVLLALGMLAGDGLAAGYRPVIPAAPLPRLIGVADGLPSSTVNDIAEDSAGYVWLATLDGLARYDGVEMRVWRHQLGDPSSLPGNYVTVIHVDARDRVWAAIEGRAVSVMPADGKGFRHLPLPEVWAIASQGDELWFGTFGDGVHRLDTASGSDATTRYLHDAANPATLPADIVLALTHDRAGTLWAGTTAGLARWTGQAFEPIALPGGTPGPVVYSISVDGDALWIGTSAGVFRRDGDGRWSEPDWSPMFALGNAVFAVETDGDGGYWLASQRQLWRVAGGGVPYPVTIGAHGPVRPLQAMLRQRSGAVWFPVAGVGLGYLRPDWRRVASFSRARGGLGGDIYRDLVPSGDGTLWMVAGNGVIERMDRHGRVLPLGPQVRARLEGLRPQTALEDPNGRLWMGETGNMRGLLRLDPVSGAIRRWSADSAEHPTLAGGQIDHMALAPDGSLWLSSAGKGLQQRDVDTGAVLRTIRPGPGQAMGLGDLEDIGFAPDGRLWIAGSEGLARWDAAAERFLPLPGIDVDDKVFGFAFDGDAGVWLQHLAGLELYQRDGDRWQRVDQVGETEGIPALEGSGLAVDARGRVWLPSRRGLFRWDPRTRQVRSFGLPDGLSSQEFLDQGSTLTGEGVLASALADGSIVLIDTGADDPPARQPGLSWARIEVRRNGRWVPLDPDRPTLAPSDRELRVQLSLLAFDNPGGNRYFTRLDGYETDWVDQGHVGERILAGLAPGRYVLHGRGTDAAGNDSAELELAFRVQPPWWRTAWARAGMVAGLVLLGGWAVAAYRDRRRRRQDAERAAQERELVEQASLAKTRFLATLGHEVRTPMTGVLGMSELLLGTPLDRQQLHHVESIRKAGEHLLRLVNDALDLARIESGKLELAAEPFDLHALVDEVVVLTEPLVRQRGLAFLVDFGGNVPRGVCGDKVRLRQVLLNLLGNATKFTERGSITLAIDGDGDGDAGRGVCFSVTDTGPGISRELQGRLFQRFEQAENARTPARHGGSGLGLAICQELAIAMGGSITVRSEPGAGARFVVCLPLPEADLPSPPPHVVLPPRSRPMALLLVEDDPTVAEVLVGLLQVQGHRVTHASHGLSAMAEAASARFDAALLDLDLPGLDGLDLARHLRAQGFAAPLLAITARADAEAEPAAKAAGFDRFLRKPVTGAMLRELLDFEPRADAAEPGTPERVERGAATRKSTPP